MRGRAKDLEVPAGEPAETYRAEMLHINEWIGQVQISSDFIRDGNFLDTGDRWMRRIFNNGRLDHGGRLYGGFWQTMSQEDRLSDIQLNGEPVASLDFDQCAVRIAYGIAGAQPPEGDLYCVPGLERYRDGVKVVLNSMLARSDQMTRRPAGTGKRFPRDFSLREIEDPIFRHHYAIRHLCYRGAAWELLYPCENRPTAGSGKGLNRLYCRKHIEHYRRHGSYVKKSYGAGELRPYRAAAERWLREHAADPTVTTALGRIRELLSASGNPVEAFRLAGRSPTERARNVLALLAKRGVDPAEIAAAFLAVRMRLRDDPQPDRHAEYRNVQAAKLLHRMAGGTHRRWERKRANGSVEVTELHRHPVSRGLVLRALGKQVADACGGLPLPRSLSGHEAAIGGDSQRGL